MIDHDGSGLSLTGGGKTVELTDFEIDPGKSVLTGKVSVDGAVAAESAPLFFLDGRTLNPLKANDDGTAELEGTTVKLKQEAADLLNQTFEVDALTAGLVIGVAKITVNTAAWQRTATGRARAGTRAPSRIAGFSTKYQLSAASANVIGRIHSDRRARSAPAAARASEPVQHRACATGTRRRTRCPSHTTGFALSTRLSR